MILPFHLADEPDINVSTSLVDKIYGGFSDGLHFATPSSSLRTNEVDLVCPHVSTRTCNIFVLIGFLLTLFPLGKRCLADIARFI